MPASTLSPSHNATNPPATPTNINDRATPEVVDPQPLPPAGGAAANRKPNHAELDHGELASLDVAGAAGLATPTTDTKTGIPGTTTTTILVCTTCASRWEEGQRVGISGGEHLLSALSEAMAEAIDADGTVQTGCQRRKNRSQAAIALKPVACMSACSQACTIALSAPGKHTYLFGGLPHDPTDRAAMAEAIAAILTCADLYGDRSDGLLAWGDRPEVLKRSVIARIPPLN